MFDSIMIFSLIMLAFAIVIGLFRVIKGPSMPDRVIALDLIGINMIAFTGVLSILMRTTAYLEIILLLGILAFIGTVALAKYIERGTVIEHKRD